MRSALADEFFITDLRSLIYSGRKSDRFFFIFLKPSPRATSNYKERRIKND